MGKHGAKKKTRFVGIPYHIAASPQFASLNAAETKLLIDLLVQYGGFNNGKLSPTIALLKKRGWAASSLHKAFKGLKEKGFLVVTRQGRKLRGYPTLVAITWLSIDECKVEYDEGIKPGKVALNLWRKPEYSKVKPACVIAPLAIAKK
mgnify:CR=1 FL=1